MTQKTAGWHPEDIKAALRKQFGTLSALSEDWGLDRSEIANTIRRPFNSMRTERRIAEALSVPLHELWPDRWRPDGSPYPRSIEMNPRGRALRPERQKRAVA